MRVIERIGREPVALTAVVVAIYGVLTAFDVITLSSEEHGAVGVLGSALVFALRWFVTPSGEVVAQEKPGEVPKAGPASDIPTGVPVAIQRRLHR